ncbi:hypothetical protein D3C73_1044430 [compost metagenome]
MAHHQHRMSLSALFPQPTQVAFGQRSLGTMGTNAHHIRAVSQSFGQVGDGAPTGQHKHPHLAVLQRLAHGGQHLFVTQCRTPHLIGGSPQPVTVADFNHRHTGFVRRSGVASQLRRSELVFYRMLTIAQG